MSFTAVRAAVSSAVSAAASAAASAAVSAAVSAVIVVAAASCQPQPPAADLLRVQGALQGPAGAVDVDFADVRTRGEWWPCDVRLTTQACVEGDFHVGVFLGLPAHDDLSDLGRNTCTVDGVAQGAFEILQSKFDRGDPALIPDDISAFALIGSDGDGDGSADLANPDETHASTHIVEGAVEIGTLFGFEEPFSFRLTGQNDQGQDVVVEYRGAMSNPALVPGLEAPSTCVAE